MTETSLILAEILRPLSSVLAGFAYSFVTILVLRLARAHFERSRACVIQKVDPLAFAYSWQGLGAAVLIPALYLMAFHSLPVDIWLSMGQWPPFGSSLPLPHLQLHLAVVVHPLMGMIFGLGGIAFMFLVSLGRRSWCWLTVPLLLHSAFVAVAFFSMWLAPGPFLNWFFD